MALLCHCGNTAFYHRTSWIRIPVVRERQRESAYIKYLSTMDKDLLISCVMENTEIWDQRHKAHHNRYILDKRWAEVAGKCGATGKQKLTI